MLIEDTKPKDEVKPDAPQEDSAEEASEKKFVAAWQDKIKKAKAKYEDDFDRMRANMDFVASLQWKNQKTIHYKRYVVNMTLRAINQGVASLYARNPKISAKPRKRLIYKLWDGKVETIQHAIAEAGMLSTQGMIVPPEHMALLNDYQQGKTYEALVKKVCETLEMVYQYQIDQQQPRYKTQLKQLVRRVRVCGVGYIKVQFCREYESDLTQSETRLAASDRIAKAQAILEKLAKDEITETSPEVTQLRALVTGLSETAPSDAETTRVKESITFDFPQATSIIPDPATRSLKGWVGSHWLVEEFHYDLDFVNNFYELRGEDAIKGSGDGSAVVTNIGGKKTSDSAQPPYVAGETPANPEDSTKQKKVRLWQVYDLDTKTSFVICDGHKKLVQKPEALTPATSGFWTIFPVTFNDIEVEEGCEATIFPPSDVDLLRPIQQERNRTRDMLRRHRIANRPRYLYIDGTIDAMDLDEIEEADDNDLVKLKGVSPEKRPSELVEPFQSIDIKPELYDTGSLDQDALLATGQQEANIGPAQPDVTATVGTIAEQSRMSVVSSDVDGLDDTLTDVACCVKDIIFQEFSKATVDQIVGEGVFPEDEMTKQQFLNNIAMEVKAASSGKPNQAIEISNLKQIVPLIVQAASMPPQFQPTIQAVIRELIKRLDDSLDPSEFFPLPVPPVQPAPPAANGSAKPNPRGKRNDTPAEQGGQPLAGSAPQNQPRRGPMRM